MKNNKLIFIPLLSGLFLASCNNNKPQPEPVTEYYKVSVVSDNTLQATVTKIKKGEDLNCKIVLDDSKSKDEYTIPDELDSVTSGNALLVDGDYTYNASNGNLTIPNAKITGDITIEAEAYEILDTNCTVTFHARGGSFDLDYKIHDFDFNVEVGTPFSSIKDFINTPTALGGFKDFCAWSYTNGKYDPVDDDFIIYKNIDLYAVYSTDYAAKINFVHDGKDANLLSDPIYFDKDELKPSFGVNFSGVGGELFPVEIHFEPKVGHEDENILVNWDDGEVETIPMKAGVATHNFVINEKNSIIDADVSLIGNIKNISLADEDGMYAEANNIAYMIYLKDIEEIPDSAFDFYDYDFENLYGINRSDISKIVIEKDVNSKNDIIKIGKHVLGNFNILKRFNYYDQLNVSFLFNKGQNEDEKYYSTDINWRNALNELKIKNFDRGVSITIDTDNVLFGFSPLFKQNKDYFYYYSDCLKADEVYTIYCSCYDENSKSIDEPSMDFSPVVVNLNGDDSVIHYTANRNNKDFYKIDFALNKNVSDINLLLTSIEKEKNLITIDPNGGTWEDESTDSKSVEAHVGYSILKVVDYFMKDHSLTKDEADVYYFSYDKEGKKTVNLEDLVTKQEESKPITVYAQYDKSKTDNSHIALLIHKGEGQFEDSQDEYRIYDYIDLRPGKNVYDAIKRIDDYFLPKKNNNSPTYYTFKNESNEDELVTFKTLATKEPKYDATIFDIPYYELNPHYDNPFVVTIDPNGGKFQDPELVTLSISACKGESLFASLWNRADEICPYKVDPVTKTQQSATYYTIGNDEHKELVDQNYIVTKDITIYAQYDDNFGVNVTIDGNGGKGIIYDRDYSNQQLISLYGEFQGVYSSYTYKNSILLGSSLYYVLNTYNENDSIYGGSLFNLFVYLVGRPIYETALFTKIDEDGIEHHVKYFSKDAKGEEPVELEDIVTGDITIYCQY